MPILAGRITQIDRTARTIVLGPTLIFRMTPGLSLEGIDVGSTVSVIYEEAEGVRVAVEILRLSF